MDFESIKVVGFSVGGIFSSFWIFLGNNNEQIAALCALICTSMAVGAGIRKERRKHRRR